jgi:ubiquinone/menaquinone biosynthesis C-methylase UbiE
LNFRHYPEGVELVAVEPEPTMRGKAQAAARTAPVPITVVDGVADDIPADDGSADAVVVSGVLCSVADVPAALIEFRRVLKPAGELRFYEHVRSEHRLRGWFQDLADPLWSRLMGGCHPNRDTLTTLQDAGFHVDHWRDFSFPYGARFSVVAPRILGTAVAG